MITARCHQCGHAVNNIPPFLRHLRVLACKECVGKHYYDKVRGRIWRQDAVLTASEVEPEEQATYGSD